MPNLKHNLKPILCVDLCERDVRIEAVKNTMLGHFELYLNGELIKSVFVGIKQDIVLFMCGCKGDNSVITTMDDRYLSDDKLVNDILKSVLIEQFNIVLNKVLLDEYTYFGTDHNPHVTAIRK